jgi:hypothetical protein
MYTVSLVAEESNILPFIEDIKICMQKEVRRKVAQ